MNARGKTLDKTYLSIDNAEERGFIHRDYIAHCLRWSHVVKRLYEKNSYRTSRILDIGCGRELPLAKLLYSSKLIPQHYYGVDAGSINDDACEIIDRTGRFPNTVHEHTNFLNLTMVKLEKINVLTCFEVLEHVEPKMMMEMLDHMHHVTTDDCRFFISTPCWNRTDCAGNHVNEMLYEALGAAFERHGFYVKNVYGTFASIRDYGHLLRNEHDLTGGMPGVGAIFDRLREYYDTNFLSCVFAPLFPAQSRNCLWELGKYHNGMSADKLKTKFPDIQDIQRPWSSSAQWEDMAL